MNISKNNERGLIYVTTHTETNGNLSFRTIFGCGSGFGYGRRLRGVVCPFVFQCLTLELNDILHDPDTLYAFMQFLKAEAAVNVLQFYLTVG